MGRGEGASWGQGEGGPRESVGRDNEAPPSWGVRLPPSQNKQGPVQMISTIPLTHLGILPLLTHLCILRGDLLSQLDPRTGLGQADHTLQLPGLWDGRWKTQRGGRVWMRYAVHMGHVPVWQCGTEQSPPPQNTSLTVTGMELPCIVCCRRCR